MYNYAQHSPFAHTTFAQFPNYIEGGILTGMLKGIFKMFQHSSRESLNPDSPVNFIFKGIFKMFSKEFLGNH